MLVTEDRGECRGWREIFFFLVNEGTLRIDDYQVGFSGVSFTAFPIYRSMPLKRLIKSPFLLLSLPSSSIYYRCINVIKSPFEFLERNVLRIPSILIILRLLITSPVNSLSFFSQFQFRDNPFQPESTRFSKSLASYFSLYLFIYFFFIKFSVTQSE